MESIYIKLALYGSKNECARTDNVFSPISEVCNITVSLYYYDNATHQLPLNFSSLKCAFYINTQNQIQNIKCLHYNKYG